MNQSKFNSIDQTTSVFVPNPSVNNNPPFRPSLFSKEQPKKLNTEFLADEKPLAFNNPLYQSNANLGANTQPHYPKEINSNRPSMLPNKELNLNQPSAFKAGGPGPGGFLGGDIASGRPSYYN